jgi:hypothetical protein
MRPSLICHGRALTSEHTAAYPAVYPDSGILSSPRKSPAVSICATHFVNPFPGHKPRQSGGLSRYQPADIPLLDPLRSQGQVFTLW